MAEDDTFFPFTLSVISKVEWKTPDGVSDNETPRLKILCQQQFPGHRGESEEFLEVVAWSGISAGGGVEFASGRRRIRVSWSVK